MADQRRKISRYVLKRYGCPQAPGAIETHALWVGTTTIGRGRETDISLGTEIASRRHCQIDISDDQSTVTVTDNKSSNGTFLNNNKQHCPTIVRTGDLIGIGKVFRSFDELATGGPSSLYVFELLEPQLASLSLDSDDEGDADDQQDNAISSSTTGDDDNKDVICLISDDDDDDDDVLNMSQRLRADRLREQNELEMELDALVEQLERDLDADADGRERSLTPPGMLHLQQQLLARTSPDSSGTSPTSYAHRYLEEGMEVEDSPCEWSDGEHDFDVSPCDQRADDELAQPRPFIESIVIDSDDDETTSGWKSKLSQHSDSGCRRPVVKPERRDSADGRQASVVGTSKRALAVEGCATSTDSAQAKKCKTDPESIDLFVETADDAAAATDTSSVPSPAVTVRRSDVSKSPPHRAASSPNTDAHAPAPASKESPRVQQLSPTPPEPQPSESAAPAVAVVPTSAIAHAEPQPVVSPVVSPAASPVAPAQAADSPPRPARIAQRRHSLAAKSLSVDDADRLARVLHNRRPSVAERPIQVIEPRSMPPRRKSVSALNAQLKKTLKSVQSTAKRNELKNAFKNGKVTSTSSSSAAQRNATDDRKAKLKELAEAQQAKPAEVEKKRVPTKPVVKITVNTRGGFLADAANVPPKPAPAGSKKKTSPLKKGAPKPGSPPLPTPATPPTALATTTKSGAGGFLEDVQQLDQELLRAYKPKGKVRKAHVPHSASAASTATTAPASPSSSANQPTSTTTTPKTPQQIAPAANVANVRPPTPGVLSSSSLSSAPCDQQLLRLPKPASVSSSSSSSSSSAPRDQQLLRPSATCPMATFGIDKDDMESVDMDMSPKLTDYDIRVRAQPLGIRSALCLTKKSRPKRTVSFPENLTNVYFFDKELPTRSISRSRSASVGAGWLSVPPPPPPPPPPMSVDLDDILSAVTTWLPDALQRPAEQADQQVAGGAVAGAQSANAATNAAVCHQPMLREYASGEEYVNVLLPIVKMEMWHNIHQDFGAPGGAGDPEPVTVVSCKHERRSKTYRYVFECEMSSPTFRPSNEHLVIVSYSNGTLEFSFFAVLRQYQQANRSGGGGPPSACTFRLESASVKANALQPGTSVVRVQLVTNIQLELKKVDAVLRLGESPLAPAILRPRAFPLRPLDGMSYKGFELLNAQQESTICQIAARWTQPQPAVSLVDGPPGTGKSRVITNLLIHLMFGMPAGQRPAKLLVCAPSNAACDVICRRLISIHGKLERAQRYTFTMVRFGVQERMHAEVKRISVQMASRSARTAAQLEADQAKLVACIAELRAAEAGANAGTTDVGAPAAAARRKQTMNFYRLRFRQTARELALRRGASGAAHDNYKFVLGAADVVCTTLDSCVNLQRYWLDAEDAGVGGGGGGHVMCIVDEATQCTEPGTLLPLLLRGVRGLVLVGDTRQLPGTVLSRQAAELGLNRSLFARLQSAFGQAEADAVAATLMTADVSLLAAPPPLATSGAPVFRLCRQYRMHAEICAWPNRYFYDGRLETDPWAMQGGAAFVLRPYSIVGLGYAQEGGRRQQQQRGAAQQQRCAYSNASEADWVVRLLRVLEPELRNVSVAIVTPYAGQKREFEKRVRDFRLPFLSVNTVDSYQGQEKDVVIMSVVRTQGTGFLAMSERLNVALTRARKALIICGNFVSLQHNEMWRSLLDDAKRRSCYRALEHTDAETEFRAQIVEHLVKPEFAERFAVAEAAATEAAATEAVAEPVAVAAPVSE